MPLEVERLEGAGLVLRPWSERDVPVMVERCGRLRTGRRYELAGWEHALD